MRTTRLRQVVATLTAVVVLASLTVATVAAPASAAKPKCQGKTATIVGTKKGEVIRGTARRDIIVAKGGHDRIFGRGGNDLICAGNGHDTVYGGPGADTIWGQLGNDRLFGNAGNDFLAGQVGNDTLDGGINFDKCFQGTGMGQRVNCELPATALPVVDPPVVAPPPPTPPPPPSLIPLDQFLAVAWTETDGLAGYSTGDVLIARLRDTDPGGAPSIGDTVEMGRYPLDFDASGFGDWATTSHAVTGGVAVGVTTVTLDTSAGTHQWKVGAPDRYREEGAVSVAQFDDAADGAFNDVLWVQSGSPSDPQTAISLIFRTDNTVEDAFIDVVLNL